MQRGRREQNKRRTSESVEALRQGGDWSDSILAVERDCKIDRGDDRRPIADGVDALGIHKARNAIKLVVHFRLILPGDHRILLKKSMIDKINI